MHPSAIFDKLSLVPDHQIRWPKNDQPDTPRILRLFNLIYFNHINDKEKIWKDWQDKKERKMVPIYIDFDTTAPEIEYAQLNPTPILDKIEEGLMQWKIKKSVRMNEQITCLLGIGHPDSRKLIPKVVSIPDIPNVELHYAKELIEEYNQERIKNSTPPPA